MWAEYADGVQHSHRSVFDEDINNLEEDSEQVMHSEDGKVEAEGDEHEPVRIYFCEHEHE